MTSKKKSASPKKRSTSKAAPRKPLVGNLSRFLKATGISAAAAFAVASYLLHADWADLSIDSVLSRLGWQGAEQSVPPPVAQQGYIQTSFAQCPQFFPQGHGPIVPAAPSLRELCFSAFAILHSGQTKTPVFVVERLNRGVLEQAEGVERTDRFYAEARLPSAHRAQLDDYRGSGYSRGHMAPAANMATPEAMAQSFSLANMVPQDQRHNAGPWSSIEQNTRKYVLRAEGDVYVFTGPVYGPNPKTIGPGRVAVPTQLFKVVYDPHNGRSWAHLQENSPNTKVGSPISYKEFVRRTGLHLLPGDALN